MHADPKVVQKLFAQAIAITDIADREQFLTDQCARKPELLERVVKLIAAHDVRNGLLDNSTNAMDATQMHSISGQQPGCVIAGRYKLLEAIGEGGMGTVWVAEQTQPVRRKVALKLVKPGMDSKQVLARFDAERQALALMDHPNIAKVFDGGVTDQGRPFFVMEYVKGMPLTEYCDQVRLPVEERLKLFVPICQAVQHAHQKGIIHRDLKPSNVLICLYDGKPVPKVIDFGLAKAMHQPLTEQTVHTGHGLMIGTPLYMSPEQAEQNNLDVDTRTDVYSLGVMLYELLTGTTPLEKAQLKEAAFGEILRLIKEVEPPKPSTRASTNAQRASIAAQRSLDPEQLGRSIRGDLDWIIMKALDKERDRRYETANGLARDIERFLSNEAVEACPPSATYRLRKQFQKHRAAISTAAAFLLLLCVGAGVSTWQALRATTAERIAVQSEATAREQRDMAIENERQALDAKTAESTARVAEERARAAETEQRAVAETQRAEAEKQRDEAQRLQQEAIARSAQLEKLSEEQRRAIYASDMNLVRLEALRGNLPRMREILYAQLPIDRPDLRGFEWNYWYRYLTQAKRLRHFDKFRGDLDASQPVILPGAKIAAVPQGTSTILVNLENGQVLQTIPQAIGKLLNRARFAADGRSVFGECHAQAAFGGSGLLTEPRQPLPQGSLRPEGFAVYDPNAAPRIWKYAGNTFSHISYLDISDDGQFVGVLGNDVTHTRDQPACRLQIWNVASQELVLDHLENRYLNLFTLNRDGSRVAAFYRAGPLSYSHELRDVVVALDVADGKVLGVARHNDDIETAIWLPDNQRLVFTTLGVSGNQQKELLSWELDSAQPRRLSSEVMPTWAITAMSPDGRLLAISSHTTSSIRLIDTTTGSLVRTLHNEASNIESMNFSPDSTKLTAFCASGDVVQWAVAPDDDQFALRSQPLPSSSSEADLSWTFSEQQDRLAYGIRSDFLCVRCADGKELFRRDTATMNQIGVPPRLHFNPSGELLAVAVQRDSGIMNLELIDMRESKVRWSTAVKGTPVPNVRMVFTGDSTSLIVSHGPSLLNFDVKSGEQRVLNANANLGLFLVGQLRPSETGKTVFATGFVLKGMSPESLEVRDAVSGAQIWSLQNNRVVNSPEPYISGSLDVSPNGMLITCVNRGVIKLWDMATQQLVCQLSGSDCSFSPDSRSLIVTGAPGDFTSKRSVRRINGKTAKSIEYAQIVSAENGKIKTEFSFAGDPADEVHLSSDGSRLVSLHGKWPDGEKSTPPHISLWDCESGREILDLPIALKSQFFWDLQFRTTGESLTALVLSRLRGSATVGRSIVFDATPLSPEDDAELVAANWMKKLEQSTPVPQQIIEAINVNKIAVPFVREAALKRASSIPFDAEKIAGQCLEVIQRSDHDLEVYRRALSWAQALEQSQPGSLRAISLICAAQYRLGKFDIALRTLQLADKKFTATGDTSDLKWEQLRRAVEVLCLHQLSDDPMIVHRKAIELADLVHDAYITNTTDGIFWSMTTQEALRTQGQGFARQQTTPRYRTALVAAQVAAARSENRFDPVKDAATSFRKWDANGDQVISRNEAPVRTWEQVARFDRDGVSGLSLSEWSAGSLMNAATTEVARRRGSIGTSGFSRVDKNKDLRITADELGDNVAFIRQWDTDQNGELSSEEFQGFEAQNLFVGVLYNSMIKIPQSAADIKLLILNVAVEEYPGQITFWNLRAWLLATSTNDGLRNGKQAVLDAIQACELCKYRIPSYLDTLAAAYAEQGDFEKAIQYSEKACSMVGALDNEYVGIKQRLELFKQSKPYRDVAADADAASSVATPQSLPLISVAQLSAARRIHGGEPCWSADGRQLIYSLTGFSPEFSYFESLDLSTGESKILCQGGKRPVSSPVDGTIAFEKGTQVWLADHDGKNERKLGEGRSPIWTLDGSLCYYSLAGQNSQLVCLSINKPTEFLWSSKAVFREDSNMSFSPDGKRIAWSSFGKWTVFNWKDGSEVPRQAMGEVDRGRSHWSPDGKMIAFEASIDRKPSVWLIHVDDPEPRLLADIAASPRWSPDGKTLALALQSSNEILLVDLPAMKDLSVHE